LFLCPGAFIGEDLGHLEIVPVGCIESEKKVMEMVQLLGGELFRW